MIYRDEINQIKSLGRPRHRWAGNFKMDLRKIERGGMGWIHLALVRDQC
jgi:hypothetical protein